MGSFQGHVLPGCAMWLFGLSEAVKYSLKFFGQTTITSLQLKRVTNRMELAQWAALLCASFIGMIAEQFVDHGPGFQLYNKSEHTWIYLHIWQHMTIYLFFAISAVVGLLTVTRFQIPLGLDHLMLALALFNEAIILYFHIAHRPPLDYHIHFMLFIAVFSAAICCLLEVHFREHLILQLLRTSMFLTQGTWLCQIAFVLFPRWGEPSWDQNDHENIMFITMCFSWHYAGAVLLMSIVYSIVYCLFKRLKRNYRDSAIEIEQFKQAEETYTVLLNETDDD